MNASRMGWRLGTTLLIMLGAACASAGGQGDGPQVGSAGATLLVTGVPAAGSLTVYLIPEVGGRRRVGNVRAGQETRLSFELPGSGSYRFVAETLSRAGAVSNALYLREGATVRWDLTSNIATVED